MKRSVNLFSLCIAAVLTIGFELSAHAQLRIAPVTTIGDTITCHVGSSSYQLVPDHSLISAISITGKAEETQKIFDKVSGYTELRTNIYTVPVKDSKINVEICPGDVNYIVYNAAWVKAIYEETNNIWVLYAIMAHEVGHYVKGHDRTELGSNPRVELEADEYAGEVLAKMGASLDDAQAAFKSVRMRSQGHTHPPIDQRLSAVKKGWNLGKGTNGSISSTTITIPVNVTVTVNGRISTRPGPPERKDTVYKGGTDNKARFRFKTTLVQGNTDDFLKETATTITKESGTHVWDNEMYSWRQTENGPNLLLAWKDLTAHCYGWVVVQNNKEHWFYKANDDRGEWHLIEPGEKTTLSWSSSGQRIKIFFYTETSTRSAEVKDLQYGFGY